MMNQDVSRWILEEFEIFVSEHSRALPKNIVSIMRDSFIFNSEELVDFYLLNVIHLGQWFGRIERREE